MSWENREFWNTFLNDVSLQRPALADPQKSLLKIQNSQLWLYSLLGIPNNSYKYRVNCMFSLWVISEVMWFWTYSEIRIVLYCIWFINICFHCWTMFCLLISLVIRLGLEFFNEYLKLLVDHFLMGYWLIDWLM